MPKSKRDKKISLTKTDKKGLALKQKIVEDVRNCVEKYSSIYVFSFENMRNSPMKDVREQWRDSRFFFGKNRVLALGLGRTKEEEVQDDLHKITDRLKGQCALFFTNSPKREVIEWFGGYSHEDYARSGCLATMKVKLSEGPLVQFSHAIEPYLRKLGLPTKLERGIVTLIKDYTVCKKDTVLSPEQAKILELLGHQLATFKLNLKARWDKTDGFEVLGDGDEVEMEDDEDD